MKIKILTTLAVIAPLFLLCNLAVGAKTTYQTCPTLKQLQAKCNQGVCPYEFPELGIDKAAFDKKKSLGKLKFNQASFVVDSNSKNTLEGALAECQYKFENGKKVVVVSQWWPKFFLKKESLPILAKLPFPLKHWQPTEHPLHEGTEEYVCSGNNTDKCQFELLKK